MERRIRVDRGGEAAWGALDGETVIVGDERLAADDVRFLAPVEPTKVIAVHLTYRSRLEEYAARTPAEPSYFMKPPRTLNGHRGEIRRPPARATSTTRASWRS